jgi:hypothetical protein
MGQFDKRNLLLLCRLCLPYLRRVFSISCAWEVLISAAISLVPLLAAAVVELRFAPDGQELLSTILKPFGGGQLFIYGFSVLAVVFLILNDTSIKKLRKIALPITVFCMIMIGIYIGADPKNTDLANRQIVSSSYYFYLLCLIIHYLVLSFSRAIPPQFQETMDDGVDRLDRQSRELENNA